MKKWNAIWSLNTLFNWLKQRLFNSRIQIWFDHFKVKKGEILPLSTIGEATIKLLALNQTSRLDARFEMMLAGCYL